ncbi:MAG: minor capsid protein [Pseudacidovorax sp.]|uniref:phage head morphogenesis protein n=1 Tax=Pseudacidovorax sp. TaxID=1934311 RepID=UPI001B75D5C9|nr:phage minor head protein [Pseudacidovorax sp.]MBP6897396.1 minor capsid protein [Pseudacidovorax sp.]
MPTIQPFGVRFQEAIDNLRGKLPEATLAWDDLAGVVHGKVFAVAGATKADLLRDLQAAVVKAKESGGTITSFRKDFDAAVAEHGWTYRGARGWRTSVIFNANMRSAAMAGRWAQIQAGKDRRPFLQYRTAGDARVRPQHRAWNGLVYPVDDAFWQTHYPPNGWGCRCTVRAYSQGDLDSKGLQVSEPIPAETREVITRDGEIKDRVPVGIDPGWDHNVGTSWIAPELALGQKLARLPRQLQGILVDKTVSPAFQRVLEGNWKRFRTAVAAGEATAASSQVVGFLDSATLEGLASVAPSLGLQSTAVSVLDDQARRFAVPPASGGGCWPADWVDDLPGTLRDYRAVLWDANAGRLVVIPQGTIPGAEGRLPQLTLLPNVATKQGATVSVVRADTVAAEQLRNAGGLVLLAGKL